MGEMDGGARLQRLVLIWIVCNAPSNVDAIMSLTCVKSFDIHVACYLLV